MAEPALPLPNSTPKNEPVPWPNAVEPVTLETQQGSLDVPGSNARPNVDDLKESLGNSVNHYFEKIQRGYEEAQRAASRTLSRTNRKFRYMAEERPMQIVMAVAIASLLTGAALRIWRSNHD